MGKFFRDGIVKYIKKIVEVIKKEKKEINIDKIKTLDKGLFELMTPIKYLTIQEINYKKSQTKKQKKTIKNKTQKK